jgi:hypothetical protein
LRHTLDQHPSFRARKDSSPETSVFARPHRIFKLDKENGRRPWRYLLENESAARELGQQLGARADWERSWRRWVVGWLEGRDAESLRAIRWRAAGRHHQLRAFFRSAHEARGCQRLLEKTPRHVLFLPEVFATFPKAQVLICVRHPVEVYSSLKKRLARSLADGIQPDRGGWQRIDLDEFVGRYARIVDIALARVASQPGQCRLVRYEALTGEPERELRAICEFLGEPFDEVSLLGERQVARDDHGSPNPRARLVANYKRWSEFISAEDAGAIESRLTGPMARLGYEPVSGADIDPRTAGACAPGRP